jgi:hypothetical protein
MLFTSEQPAYRATINVQQQTPSTINFRVRNRLILLGWRIIERRTRINHIVSVINETLETRDVLLLDISTSGEVRMWIRNEIKIEGHWVAPDCVCPGYTYFREQTLFEELNL